MYIIFCRQYNTFEFNMEPQQATFQRDQIEYAQQSSKIIKRLLYSSHSKNNQTTLLAYLHEAVCVFSQEYHSSYNMFLLKNTSLPQSAVISNDSSDDWPFKKLFLIKKRTQDQQFLFEFISMCASKIQSYFRMYITNRRHKIAINKLKRFQVLGVALIRGWKVRKVMQCNRIKDSIKIIKEKRNELNQLSKSSSDANFNLKKQLYTKSVLRDEINQLKVKFNNFVKNGQWVFEPRDAKVKLKKANLVKEVVKAENVLGNPKDEDEQAKIVPKKQNRQMRNHAKKIKQEMRQLKKQNMQTENTSTPSTFTSKQIDQNFFERPIKAKGAYIFNEQDNNIPEAVEKQTEPKSEVENEKKEVRKNEIKKLQKRTKYDPRKAILEQKKKKKEEEGIKKECNASIQKHTQKKQPQINVSKEQVVAQDGEKINNRSTISIGGKVAKVKVESKVNCWGNRKTVIKKQGPQKQRSYTNIHLKQGELKERRYEKAQKPLKTEITMEKLANKIFEKKKMHAEIHKQEQQAMNLKQKVRENLEEVNRISLTLNEGRNIKQYSEFMQSQRNRYQQLSQQNIRGVIRKSPENKPKQQVFRSIDELQDTYSKQYSVRLQNLMPKLGFLSTARKAEQIGSIPVISSDSSYVIEVLNLPNQHFLHQTNIMEKNFNLMLRH